MGRKKAFRDSSYAAGCFNMTADTGKITPSGAKPRRVRML
jgi:hypothetical protein